MVSARAAWLADIHAWVASASNTSAAAGAVADYVAKIEAELRARSGPRGWSYEFAKLFAIARKPV
jgi:hypothetical protein